MYLYTLLQLDLLYSSLMTYIYIPIINFKYKEFLTLKEWSNPNFPLHVRIWYLRKIKQPGPGLSTVVRGDCFTEEWPWTQCLISYVNLFMFYYNNEIKLLCQWESKQHQHSTIKSLSVLKPKEISSLLVPICTYFSAGLTERKEKKMHAPLSTTSVQEKRPGRGHSV